MASEGDELVGTVVDEWEIVDRIGQGGIGSVYRARKGRRQAAIKVLRPGGATPDSVERLRREAQLLMQLDHPNVVLFFQAGETHGFIYLAMELLPGGSLEDLVKARGPLSVPQAVGALRALLDALAAVHALGVVHRDLKPANVLIDRAGHPKLADLGLARIGRNPTITGPRDIVGTAEYMAPEQYRGGTVDARADLYSAGATLYHLLVGRPPYEGASQLKILEQHLKAPVPDLARDLPDAPAALVKAVRALMAKDPAERPESAAAAKALLEGLPEAPLVDAAPGSADDAAGPAPAPAARPGIGVLRRVLRVAALLAVGVVVAHSLEWLSRLDGYDALGTLGARLEAEAATSAVAAQGHAVCDAVLSARAALDAGSPLWLAVPGIVALAALQAERRARRRATGGVAVADAN